MIEAQKLTRTFGAITAVSDLDLAVEKGEVFGFLGPNGAGKTTTIRMLAALIAPTSGSATVAGFRVGRENRSIRQNVGVLTETPGLYKRLSALDNLLFFARLYGVNSPEKQAERYLRLFELWDRRDQLAGGFSKGMRQKLALARALLHEPQVLFLDEPTAGLDPEAAKVVRDLIETLRTRERTIFLCTHNLDEAERLCDRVALFKTRLVALGRPSELKERMYGRRTVVRLLDPPAGIEEALDLPFIKRIERDDGALVISLTDPERENPILVKRLVELGAKVQSVSELDVRLEEMYLDVMEGDDAAD
ncbi:multidrug ABC transporter ATP-binding protein [Candidatus Acetothermia bacterium]|nr:MAG: multidrug ABC transporter ATP-binding protein [Candidatus Acetothermia bacterium]